LKQCYFASHCFFSTDKAEGQEFYMDNVNWILYSVFTTFHKT